MNRRITTLLLAIILCIGAGSAQVRFGLKAGINVNSLRLNSPSQTFSTDNRTGFTGGVTTEITIPFIGLCLDVSLMYTHMGANEGDSHNFFEIPVNLKYKLNIPIIARILRPYLFTGPDFAFKLGSGDENYTKTFQCAWNLGLGVELLSHLQIGASYGFGMNNVLNQTRFGTGNEKVRNNYWTITAAYFF